MPLVLQALDPRRSSLRQLPLLSDPIAVVVEEAPTDMF